MDEYFILRIFKHIIGLMVGIAATASTWAEQPWETDTLSENREPMRAYAHQYRTEADALTFDRANSIHQSLDGEWKFSWSKVPEG